MSERIRGSYDYALYKSTYTYTTTTTLPPDSIGALPWMPLWDLCPQIPFLSP